MLYSLRSLERSVKRRLPSDLGRRRFDQARQFVEEAKRSGSHETALRLHARWLKFLCRRASVQRDIWPQQTEYKIARIRSGLKLPVATKALRFLRRTASSFLEKLKYAQPNGVVHYRFWQRGGGYDRNVIEPGTLWQMIEYIHNNPVRRGLVNVATEWVWSSARFYAGIRPVPIEMDPLPSLIG